VRAGVTSRGASPSNSRIAGKAIRRGGGGITRNNHQMIGSPASADSSHGEAKASEPKLSIDQTAALTGSAARAVRTSIPHGRWSPDNAA
jgi:hypothetical protein